MNDALPGHEPALHDGLAVVIGRRRWHAHRSPAPSDRPVLDAASHQREWARVFASLGQANTTLLDRLPAVLDELPLNADAGDVALLLEAARTEQLIACLQGYQQDLLTLLDEAPAPAGRRGAAARPADPLVVRALLAHP
jgi:hypothetical protein